MTGSEFLAQMKDVRIPMLSKLGLAEMLKGNMPPFLDQRIACHTEAVIDGGYYKLTYYVKPNYLAIGTDADFILWPLSIIDLQNFCDAFVMTAASDPTDKSSKYFIPPKKIVFNNWLASTCKIPPQALGASDQMTWPVKIGEEQARINAAMIKAGCQITDFSRAKKAYISAPNMANTGGPTKEGVLHFTGWYGTQQIIPNERKVGEWNGQTVYGVQGGDDTGGHEASYADYSHGCDVVYYDCDVNGMAFEFDQICTHPKLHVLVSDQGPFNPRFPNIGPDARAPKTTTAMPAPLGVDANYKGPVFKSTATGLVQMAIGDPAAAASIALADPEASSDGTNPLLILGIGAALAAGAYFLFRKPSEPSAPMFRKSRFA